jgi:hypothetical protein
MVVGCGRRRPNWSCRCIDNTLVLVHGQITSFLGQANPNYFAILQGFEFESCFVKSIVGIKS